MSKKRLLIRELEYLETIADNYVTILGGSVKVNSYISASAQGSSLAATRGGLEVTIEGGGGEASSFAGAYAQGSSLVDATASSYNFLQVTSD